MPGGLRTQAEEDLGITGHHQRGFVFYVSNTPSPTEALSALLSNCSLLYFQRCMGWHCISILGLMARRSDMTKQKWSIKSFAKQFSSLSTKALKALKGTLKATRSQQHLNHCKFTTFRSQGTDSTTQCTHCSPSFSFSQGRDHWRVMEQCEISWDRNGKGRPVKV